MIRITPQTRLNRVLDLQPDVVAYIVALNPHDFARLRQPLMRRFMSPRITLSRVAAMGHVPVAELLDHIAALTGAVVAEGELEPVLPQSSREPPAWVTAADPRTTHTINLLPLDATLTTDPLLPVITAIKELTPGAVLLIKHQWEPQPLYDIWTKMGNLAWFSAQISPTEWWIWVRRYPDE
ncbi:MAG: DUF1858 domain-containing protein [Herpetosiphonaceae bacterium]|nr:DUF1858 domain-containing protein [Herpetosiphonaceae bacterium]